jgi:hypothetical protein
VFTISISLLHQGFPGDYSNCGKLMLNTPPAPGDNGSVLLRIPQLPKPIQSFNYFEERRITGVVTRFFLPVNGSIMMI